MKKEEISKLNTYGLDPFKISSINDEKALKSKEYNKGLKIKSKDKEYVSEKDLKESIEKAWSDAIKYKEISKGGVYANPKYAGLDRKKFIEYRQELDKKGLRAIHISDSSGKHTEIVKK